MGETGERKGRNRLVAEPLLFTRWQQRLTPRGTRLAVLWSRYELLDEFGEFGSVGDAQSGASSVDVSFDRAHRHGEGVGDVFVGQAVSD